MSIVISPMIKIEKTKKSKISKVDFSNLPFGQNYTDHMFVCDFVNGEWKQPEIIPYQNISLDPAAKIFHYGQSVFEGMKAYKDGLGQTWLFRPLDNQKRRMFGLKEKQKTSKMGGTSEEFHKSISSNE